MWRQIADLYLPLLLIKDSSRSTPLTVCSLTWNFGAFYSLPTHFTHGFQGLYHQMGHQEQPSCKHHRDIELNTIITAGRPHAIIPSVSTIRQDINVSFVKCREKISKLLKVCARPSVSGC